MKKIVSTMFKCGAVCVSTTVFGDRVSSVEDQLGLILAGEPSRIVFGDERTIECGLGLDSDCRFTRIISGQGTGLREEIFPVTPKDERDRRTLWYANPGLHYRDPGKLFPVFKERGDWHGTLTDALEDGYINLRLGTFLDTVPLSTRISNERNTYYLLALVAEKTIKTPGKRGYSLHPNDISVHIVDGRVFIGMLMDTQKRTKSLWLCGSAYNQMQSLNGPNEPFAFLMLYALIPELRSRINANEVCVSGGRFYRFSKRHNGYVPLQECNQIIALATALYNGKISMSDIWVFLKNPGQYQQLIDAMEDSVDQTTFEERQRARREVLSFLSPSSLESNNYVHLVKITHPLLFSVSRTLASAENGNRKNFIAMAKRYPAAIEVLLDMSDTKRNEEGRIIVSEETFDRITQVMDLVTHSRKP